MLRRLRDCEGWTVHGRDGDVGTVGDFYFDDERWTVRYLVVRTGGWLTGREVLVSPMSFGSVDWEGARFDVKLTRDQVRDAPPVDTARPVSRRYEIDYAGYYGYPYYWAGSAAWGMAPTPMGVPLAADVARAEEPRTPEESHLRSVHEVTGYHIRALDGDIGHVDDFFTDGESWTIRYLMVDTSNWIGGRSVLVSPAWVRTIDWAQQLVHVDLTREHVHDSPEYVQGMDIDRAYEERLYAHYSRPAYWRGLQTPHARQEE